MYNTNKPLYSDLQNMDSKLFGKYVRYHLGLVHPLSRTTIDTTDRDGNEVIIIIYKHSTPLVITKVGGPND